MAVARRIYFRVSRPVLMRLIYLALLGTGISLLARALL